MHLVYDCTALLRVLLLAGMHMRYVVCGLARYM